MSNSIRAFICYRRSDAFIPKRPSGRPDTSFVEKVKQALTDAGAADVFWDQQDIEVLAHYESTAFEAIEACDLFVALIGNEWLKLYEDRKAKNRRDAVVREIRAALELEKKILIVKVDGAEVPSADLLTRDIERFHYQNGIDVSSGDPVATLVAAVIDPVKELSQDRKIGTWWRTLYIVAACLAYLFCAFNPNWVGYNEYGPEAWKGLAKAWSGLFIWPILFLPFVLYALYRPLTTIAEAMRGVPSKAAIYMAPLIVSAVLAVIAWTAEVFDENQVPWTIFPSLPQPSCQSGPAPVAPDQRSALSPQERERLDAFDALSAYDQSNALAAQYPNVPFWLRNRCWPNIFFYLTVPIYSGKADANYFAERQRQQKAFVSILKDPVRIRMGVPYSRTGYAYRISFAILVWLGLSGVVLSGFYLAVRIRDPRSQEARRLPSEDAFICLTYSLATLMTWIPFRMNTEYFKYIYQCRELPCDLDPTNYLPDMLLGSMLFCGYLFCTLGLLAKYRRVVLSILGATTIGLCAAAGWAVYNFRDVIARLTEFWQFYAVISVPSIALFFVLWLAFDPRLIHKSDFRRDIDY
jgi:hypothetical protein